MTDRFNILDNSRLWAIRPDQALTPDERRIIAESLDHILLFYDDCKDHLRQLLERHRQLKPERRGEEITELDDSYAEQLIQGPFSIQTDEGLAAIPLAAIAVNPLAIDQLHTLLNARPLNDAWQAIHDRECEQALSQLNSSDLPTGTLSKSVSDSDDNKVSQRPGPDATAHSSGAMNLMLPPSREFRKCRCLVIDPQTRFGYLRTVQAGVNGGISQLGIRDPLESERIATAAAEAVRAFVPHLTGSITPIGPMSCSMADPPPRFDGDSIGLAIAIAFSGACLGAESDGRIAAIGNIEGQRVTTAPEHFEEKLGKLRDAGLEALILPTRSYESIKHAIPDRGWPELWPVETVKEAIYAVHGASFGTKRGGPGSEPEDKWLVRSLSRQRGKNFDSIDLG